MNPFKATVKLETVGTLEITEQGIYIKQTEVPSVKALADQLDIIHAMADSTHGNVYELFATLCDKLGLRADQLEVISLEEEAPTPLAEGTIE